MTRPISITPSEEERKSCCDKSTFANIISPFSFCKSIIRVDVACLVDVLVDAAPLPEHVRAAHLAGVLLLVDHGAAVLCGVVLYYMYHIISVLYLYFICTISVLYHHYDLHLYLFVYCISYNILLILRQA